jgi:hypothetical protein
VSWNLQIVFKFLLVKCQGCDYSKNEETIPIYLAQRDFYNFFLVDEPQIKSLWVYRFETNGGFHLVANTPAGEKLFPDIPFNAYLLKLIND